MGRTREFDEDAVLEQATRLFWHRGYDAVSIQDLESATGVGRGSLYHAFGDKEGVFLAVLDRYLATQGTPPFDHLDHPDVGEGIRRMFAAITARLRTPGNPRGCLLTNTSLVAVGTSGRIETRIAESMSAMEALLKAAIVRAQRERQIPASVDATALARFYCAVAQSLAVEHRIHGDDARLEDIVATAIQTWPGRRRGRALNRRRSRR